jgi:hypothetical protein
LNPSAITRQRLSRQQIRAPLFSTPGEVVRWMGAIQAQDYLGSLWAVGLRLPSAVESEIEEAVSARIIVRTWPMRGTLHFVPAADVRWMLRLLTPRVIARSAGRYRELGLDVAVLSRSRKVVTRALAGGRGLTRPEVYAELQRGGVSPEGQRGIHILGHLAQHGLICFGPRKGKQATFVLLEEWLPAFGDLSREEALATLADRYFSGHGPATVHDFAWWTGLVIKEAQEAIAAAGSALVSESSEGRRWFSAAAGARPAARARRRAAVLLPPWDEYVVAYKDRSAALERSVGPVGRLYAIGLSLVVIDGRVRGSWRRALAGSTARVRLDFWTRVTREERRAVERAAQRYGRFLGRPVQID